MIDTSEDITARLAADDQIRCTWKNSCRGVVGRYSGGVVHLPSGMTEMLLAGDQSTTPRSFRLGKRAERQQAQGNSGARTRSTKRLPGDQDYVVPSYLIGTVGGSDVIRVKCPNCGAWNRIDQAVMYTETLERLE